MAGPGAGPKTGRPPGLSDRDRFATLLSAAVRPPSEYAFANIFLFRARHDYRTVETPVPHLSGIAYDGVRHALPLGDLDADGARLLLADHDCLYPFGAEGIATAARLGLACRFDEADSDYIYDAADMAALANAKTRRAQARAFETREAPRYETGVAGLAAAMGAVLEGWFADVGRSPGATDIAECREAIALAGPLALEAALVRTGDGTPAAFLLASRGRDDEHIVHFAKGRRAHPGAYPWLFARYAATSGAARLNFEQDLGNPGFAQSKGAYAPAERRRKYRLMRG